MDAYTLLQISEAAGVVLLGLGATRFSHRAMKYSEPTGNGFAGRVKGDLTILVKELRDTRQEICTLKTDLNYRLDRMENRFDRHLDTHSRE